MVNLFSVHVEAIGTNVVVNFGTAVIGADRDDASVAFGVLVDDMADSGGGMQVLKQKFKERERETEKGSTKSINPAGIIFTSRFEIQFTPAT